jgi:ketosteroid isomerase-like protein
MSEENVEFVRALYGEMGGSGWDAVIANRELIAPNVELDFSDIYPDAPMIRGFEQALQVGESGPWGRSARVEAERILDVDDERVLVLVHVTATGQESGVDVEMRDAHEITIRGGVVVRLKVYADRDEALEAVGLRE